VDISARGSVLGFARWAAKAVLLSALPPRRILARLPQAADGAASVALTFDDGPHPEHTPRLLDLLGERRVPATFFVVGEGARRHPGIVRRIVAEGHDLGNHTYTHGDPRRTSPAALMDEVRRTRALLEDLTGHPCRLFRPPRGAIGAGKLLRLWADRQVVVLWSIDTRDCAMRSSHEMRAFCSLYRPEDGDIVLMHDDTPHAATAVEALPRLAAFRDVKFVRVSEGLSQWRPRRAEGEEGALS
jgi:peptidoglycan/xylan/chitin deacetylase (PgdA/CDA1 family)